MLESIPSPAACRRAAALCGALMLAGAAWAADPAKPQDAKASAPGKGGGDQPVLTRNQLRACLTQQDKLTAMQAEVMKEQNELDAEKAAIEQQRQDLKTELDALDRTNAAAVEAYNAKAAEQDKRIDAYNQRGAPFNQRASDWKEQRGVWEKDCSNRRYDENDLTAIKAGR